MKAEYPENRSCPQKDSAEHEEYVGAQSVGGQEVGEQDGAGLLERILSRDNLNRAYKRVRANKGAPGIDGMTIEDALPWLREHREELLENIRQGKYKPPAGAPKGDPQAGWRCKKVGYPDSHRPHHSAGNRTATGSDLRTAVLGRQLWLSPEQKRTAGDS